ncbi:hypothetical protein HYDPIDRAFT_46053, partial [Hydnomerulius pinastri MD-312]
LSLAPSVCHLFSYKEGGTLVPLTKRKFLEICDAILKPLGHGSASRMSFRTGGTNALLERGVSPEVVKQLGRWSSDGFRKHQQSQVDHV